MILNRIIIAISFVSVLLSLPRPVYAVNTPNFGSCVNPQGKVIASYEDGKHGIVGMKGEVSGSDSVYQSSKNGVTQCFCPVDGQGIQTNWYDVSSVSQKDIDILKKEGWTYFATGSKWGLKDVPYVAKNADYACNKTAVKKSKTTEVLKLASTGETQTIYVFLLAGAAFLITGLILRKFSK
jgi:LPXTG-motif cell wall-anchored protein